VLQEGLSSEQTGPNYPPILHPPPMGKSFTLIDPANRQTILVFPERKFARIIRWPAEQPPSNGPAGFPTLGPPEGSDTSPHRAIGRAGAGAAFFAPSAFAIQKPTPPPMSGYLPHKTEHQYSEQMLEGLAACEERVTNTYPKGTFDDPKDELEVDDRWYSPYLDEMVLIISNFHGTHGRYGGPLELVFSRNDIRMTDIKLQEPDPALFVIPQDYKVETQQLP
jgi:hypothetical protein